MNGDPRTSGFRRGWWFTTMVLALAGAGVLWLVSPGRIVDGYFASVPWTIETPDWSDADSIVARQIVPGSDQWLIGVEQFEAARKRVRGEGPPLDDSEAVERLFLWSLAKPSELVIADRSWRSATGSAIALTLPAAPPITDADLLPKPAPRRLRTTGAILSGQDTGSMHGKEYLLVTSGSRERHGGGFLARTGYQVEGPWFVNSFEAESGVRAEPAFRLPDMRGPDGSWHLRWLIPGSLFVALERHTTGYTKMHLGEFRSTQGQAK